MKKRALLIIGMVATCMIHAAERTPCTPLPVTRDQTRASNGNQDTTPATMIAAFFSILEGFFQYSTNKEDALAAAHGGGKILHGLGTLAQVAFASKNYILLEKITTLRNRLEATLNHR